MATKHKSLPILCKPSTYNRLWIKDYRLFILFPGTEHMTKCEFQCSHLNGLNFWAMDPCETSHWAELCSLREALMYFTKYSNAITRLAGSFCKQDKNYILLYLYIPIFRNSLFTVRNMRAKMQSLPIDGHWFKQEVEALLFMQLQCS